MSSLHAWLMIPRLVDRYGANGARAMIDLLSEPGQDPMPGYIVRADAYLMEKKYKEAAKLYVHAAQASASNILPYKSIGLYEAALLCDSDDITVRTELIVVLSKVGWLWRVSEHLHECAPMVHPERAIEQWLLPLHMIFLDLILQKSLLHYMSSLASLFTLKVDQAKIAEVIKEMKQKSSDIECAIWKQLVNNSFIKKDVVSIL